ncbi:hypothetical protein M514_02187 [Trichuris suis]|uniref:RUN domain-containing protein n=1 Tax=Trichuris suis TaxID=68888 RepID=A0A085N9M8_9BILA|nr:hypothetical protein M514_02187 [Trichuris suis]
MDSFGALGTLGEQQKLQQDQTSQACSRRQPSLASVLTDRSPSMATTVDLNVSPGHRSSQDGSFIQDEDLHLIYGRFEYDRGPMEDIKVANCDYEDDGRQLVDAIGVPSLPKDVELHLQNKLANDCDVNVAFLDFNSFTADRIADALKDRFCKTSGSFESESYLTPPAPLGPNSCSLFSSCGGGDIDPVNEQSACSAASLFPLLPSSFPKNEIFDDVELQGEVEEDEVINGKATFNDNATQIGSHDQQQKQHPQVISTDSLDWSSYNRGQEIIKTACATKTGDYVLTFDDSASSMISSVASFSASTPESPIDVVGIEPRSDGNDAPKSIASGPTKQTMISWNQLGDDSIRRHGSLPRGKTFPGTCSPQSNRVSAQVVPFAEGTADGSNSRFSLLKAFKEKVSDTFDRMHSHGRRKMDKNSPATVIRSSEVETKSSCTGGIESSGYHTGGTQSSQMGDLQQVRKDGDAASAGSSPLESPSSGAVENDVQQRCHTVIRQSDNNYEVEYDVGATRNGRCVDINHNVIGFGNKGSGPWMGRAMAESGGEWKHVLTSNGRTFVDLLRKKETTDIPPNRGQNSMEQRSSRSPSVSVANKSVQTCLRGVPSLAPFGCMDELQGMCCPGSTSKGNVPELNFLRLPFSLPPLFPSVAPFPMSMFKRLDCQKTDFPCPPVGGDARRGVGSSYCCRPGAGFAPAKLVPSPPRVRTSKIGRTKRLGLRQPATKRDSGFESYAQVPSHIQDWESLAMLLPEEVQRTFFNGCLSKSSYGTAGRGILKSSRAPSTSCRHRPTNWHDKPISCSSRSVDNLLWRTQMGATHKGNRPLSEPCFQRMLHVPPSYAPHMEASPIRHCACMRQCCCSCHSCSGCVAYAHRNLCCLCTTWEHQETADVDRESAWLDRPADFDINHQCVTDNPCFRSTRSESSCCHCGRGLNGIYSPDCFFSMENVTRFHQYYQQPVGFTLKKCNSTRRLAVADDNADLDFRSRDATVPFTQNAPSHLRLDGMSKGVQIGVSLHRQKHDMVCKFLLSCDRLRGSLTPDATLFEKLQLLHRFVINSIVEMIEDGLVVANSVWSVIVSATKLGPATRSVCDLVNALESRNAYKNLKVDLFFLGLFRLQSLDCWLSYLVLKDNLLRKCYLKSAFLRGARSVYSFLYEKILAKIQSLYNAFKFDREVVGECSSENADSLGSTLSVLDEFVACLPNSLVASPSDKEFANAASCSAIGRHIGKDETLTKSFIPAMPAGDTRIPKSSSYPSRIPTSVDRRTNRKVVKAISRK